MFRATRPNKGAVRTFLDSQRDKSFSYAEVGASSGSPPRGYDADHNRLQLGRGRDTFTRAIEAIKRWEMFNLGWVEVFPANAPVEIGTTVAIIVNHLGFYSLNAARIVYTIDADDGDSTFGFAYGTLTDHTEQGEERFSVEYHADDDSVWYDLYAFSRPKHLLAKAGYPVSRSLQRKFARESLLAMFRAVNK